MMYQINCLLIIDNGSGFPNSKLNPTHSVINLEAIQSPPYRWLVTDVIFEEEAYLS